uniref:Uncharacterized protein n=1 Tax=Podoviridae sp. ctBev14 TaxID=2823556 RepID=A0A8S5LAT6_9CAUD|nr:MAG TPA: hypothetical protein [Podoviridae sp. ctBev14]
MILHKSKPLVIGAFLEVSQPMLLNFVLLG